MDNLRSVLKDLRVKLVFAAIMLIVVATIAVTKSAHEAIRILLPGTVTSVLAVLCISLYQQTFAISERRLLNAMQITELARELAEASNDLKGKVVMWERWDLVDWGTILAGASEMTVMVSYMDTWISQTSMALGAFFSRGGRLTLILPELSKQSIQRVTERFPEYDPKAIQTKIEKTATRLQAIQKQNGSVNSRSTIIHTKHFIMHCLVLIDGNRCVLSPFDHIRRHKVGAPAFFFTYEDSPSVLQWCKDELDGMSKRDDKAAQEMI